MRVRRVVFRLETPTGDSPERAAGLIREALAQAATQPIILADRPPGRIARLRIRVDAAAAGDRALAARIGRAIRAAVSERTGSTDAGVPR